MKHAMKKLTCLLLVAVLLVGAVPFGALAAEFDPTAGMNDNNVVMNGSLVEEVPQTVNEPVVLAPVTQAASNPAVAANVTDPVTVLVVIDYSDKADVTGEITVNAGTSAYAALCEIADAATVAEIQNNYAVTYSADSVAVGMNKLTVTCVRKPVVVNEYYVEIDIEGSKQGNTKVYKEGDVLTLNANLLSAFDLSVPAGQKIAKFIVNNADKAIGDTHTVAGGTKIVVVTVPADANTGSNNGGSTSNTAYHVDVILVNDSRTSGFASNEYHRCVLVSGKITKADRDAIAAKMPAGTIAWRRGDNGTQSSSLLNFDFSDLTQSINVFPVVGSSNSNSSNGSNSNNNNNTTTGTVYFMNANDQVMYTAPLTNGKLSNNDVINATNAANRTGYTFVGWKLNKAGSAAASDLLLNMTFANGDELYPTYMVNSTSNTLNSTKNQNDIFLNIFVNKDFYNCKTIKLNEHWVIADDKITKDEILQYVVTDYYKASNTNLGLQADMLYYSVGSFMYNWLTDNGTTTIDNISAKRAQGTVTINIMVTNAAAKSSTAVASDNPKTGDNIYTAFAVMGISAASLAAVMYVYNKKRYTV